MSCFIIHKPFYASLLKPGSGNSQHELSLLVNILTELEEGPVYTEVVSFRLRKGI